MCYNKIVRGTFGTFPVDRKLLIFKLLRNDNELEIFPERTRNKSDELILLFKEVTASIEK